ncbi:hypothetical protein VNI00_013414 [Paramarasmius palmivorus]|uniref:F-box domain-containing protein n=1 Tax=Paramarasmius palmivorus TaxID=297713 RepID=A0AAW0BZS9_9AGAR
MLTTKSLVLDLILADIQRKIAEDDALRLKVKKKKIAQGHSTSMHGIPPEILLQIFFQYMLAEQNVRFCSQYPLGWMRITHVCRYWRSLALGTPALWCKPNLAYPFVASETLSRSAQFPLDIDIQEETLWCGNAMKIAGIMLEEEISRVSSLTIRSDLDFVKAYIIPSLTHPAPLLGTLDLELRSNTKSIRLPGSFLGNFTVPNAQASSPHQRGGSSHFAIVPREWALFFSQMRQLERLVLKDDLPSEDSEAPTSPTRLPRLTFASVSCRSITNLVNFFQYIVIPAEACVALWGIAIDGRTSDDIRNQLVLLRPLLPLSASTLYLAHTTVPELTQIDMWTASPKLSSPRLRLQLTYSTTFFEDVVEVLTSMMDLTQLRTLNADIERGIVSVHRLVDCFASASQLGEITLSKDAFWAFLSGLFQNQSSEALVFQGQITFPGLRKLWIREFDMAKAPGKWKEVQNMVDRYRGSGWGRARIVVSGCVLFGWQAAYIRERGVIVDETHQKCEVLRSVSGPEWEYEKPALGV